MVRFAYNNATAQGYTIAQTNRSHDSCFHLAILPTIGPGCLLLRWHPRPATSSYESPNPNSLSPLPSDAPAIALRHRPPLRWLCPKSNFRQGRSPAPYLIYLRSQPPPPMSLQTLIRCRHCPMMPLSLHSATALLSRGSVSNPTLDKG
jgi:hypothetical protein